MPQINCDKFSLSLNCDTNGQLKYLILSTWIEIFDNNNGDKIKMQRKYLIMILIQIEENLCDLFDYD